MSSHLAEIIIGPFNPDFKRKKNQRAKIKCVSELISLVSDHLMLKASVVMVTNYTLSQPKEAAQSMGAVSCGKRRRI